MSFFRFSLISALPALFGAAALVATPLALAEPLTSPPAFGGNPRLGGDVRFRNVTIGATGTLSLKSEDGWVRVFADNIVIDGRINADASGLTTDATFAGADATGTLGATGGGFMGRGGMGHDLNSCLAPFGGGQGNAAALVMGYQPDELIGINPTTISLPGLGGAADMGTKPAGNPGGMVLLVGNTITINGSVSANGGSNASFPSGGSAGGVIVIAATQSLTLNPSASLRANGGAPGQNGMGPGGGSGGLVALLHPGPAGATIVEVAGGTDPNGCGPDQDGDAGLLIERQEANLCFDIDGDGETDQACGGQDCNDFDDAIFQGNPEVCDGVDNNCDGDTDVGPDLCPNATDTCTAGVCVPVAETTTGGGDGPAYYGGNCDASQHAGSGSGSARKSEEPKHPLAWAALAAMIAGASLLRRRS